jgi:hypothetical protein
VFSWSSSFTAYPEGDVRDAEAYKGAIEKLPKGSIVISECPRDGLHRQNLDVPQID